MKELASTYGALLIGALFASGFSGVIAVQSVVYFKLFPQDHKLVKGMVFFAWLLDTIHTVLIWVALWAYIIEKDVNIENGDYIPHTIAFSVVLTAILTLISHCFFAHRIHGLSNQNWFFTVPVLILAMSRLVCASVSGGEMIRLQSFVAFRDHYRWLFSLGLALSSGVDILITVFLFVLLQKSKSSSISLNRVVDSLIMYTFEIGSLTSAATVVSMICWICLDNSLIFLGLHFVIGKLYANSLLTTLNMRENLRRGRTQSINLLNISQGRSPPHLHIVGTQDSIMDDGNNVQVNVSKSVHYDT